MTLTLLQTSLTILPPRTLCYTRIPPSGVCLPGMTMAKQISLKIMLVKFLLLLVHNYIIVAYRSQLRVTEHVTTNKSGCDLFY
jgi:hypothetical protein